MQEESNAVCFIYFFTVKRYVAFKDSKGYPFMNDDTLWADKAGICPVNVQGVMWAEFVGLEKKNKCRIDRGSSCCYPGE